MQTPLETSPSEQYANLVTLRWSRLPVVSGSSETIVRYTNWDQDIQIPSGGDLFLSVPEIEVELAEVHGGTQDRPGKLTASRNTVPFNILRSGLAFPRITVSVEQVSPLNILATRRLLFTGSLGKVTGNPSGKAALVRVQINGIKAQVARVRLGVPATNSCQWIFGDPVTCGYDKEATKQTATVLSVGDPSRTSIRLSAGNGTSPNARFRRGIIHVGGLKLTIRESLDTGTFNLFKTPPDWLVGLPATLFEGCDKQYSTCVRFQRQTRFMGCGIRIPSRNPLFQAD